jgi:uncharacterized protein YjiS (DUF1127 family)
MSILTTISTRLERRRRESRTFSELAMLSDRDLTDLGISRSDIRRIAREAAERGVIDIHQWRERNESRSIGDSIATGPLVTRALGLKTA